MDKKTVESLKSNWGSIHGLEYEDARKNAFMCIEYETVEHYVPSGDMFILQVDTVNTDEKKCGRDTIPKLDLEERESKDSVTVAITGTEIVSSSQVCKDMSDLKHMEKSATLSWQSFRCVLINDILFTRGTVVKKEQYYLAS